MPQAKVRMKLVELKNQRKRLEAVLADSSEKLAVGVSVLLHTLDLVADPYALFSSTSQEVRRRL